jgi:general secretion pathway protein E
MRIDGTLSDVADLPLQVGHCLTNQFKALASLDPVTRFTPKDSHFRFSADGHAVDLRLALVPCQNGETISIRLLDPLRLERTIDNLGLASSKLQLLEDWLDNVNGMFLAAGPTGSGKTTTIYALLHELKFKDRRIVSIEDPIEYAIPGITQVQLDEKHGLSFDEAVKAVLRLDPDLLMMGEIRDARSAHAAVDAAITGRVLLSTVHSRDAVGAITALRNWGLPDHEIAESLAVVIAQRLVRQLCPQCRKPADLSPKEKAWLEAASLPPPKTLWAPAGCARCGGLGYSGRTGLFEFWRLNEADYHLLLHHADEHSLRTHFHTSQPDTLLIDGITKVEQGITSLHELRKASTGAFPSLSLQNFSLKPPRSRRTSTKHSSSKNRP